MSNDYVYDIETYPNVFTLAVEHAEAPFKWSFEISDHRNDSKEIIAFLQWLKDTNARLVGFNVLGFDYPVIHTLIRMGHSDANTLYQKAMAIINSQDDESRWMHNVNPTDRFIDQIDLFKIHHFDNKARATSLKVLEFNMRSDSIEDLPFPVGTQLNATQIEVLKKYNAHDVSQTKKFMGYTADMIAFREKLCVMYPGKDWINFNDTKIGKEFFAMRLEQAGVALYNYGSKGRTPRQTLRPTIALKDAILPSIGFSHPEFTRVLNWLMDQVITETKGVFNDLTATVDGFTFVFGLGGIHGSVESKVVESDDDCVIVDLDVASYYPNLAITNGFYPQHLGSEFVTIYSNLYEQRKSYPKKSAESAMLKLALNGVYGDSNSRFSVFYDPLFTMSITLNGQLLLCVLAEQLMQIDGLKLIQVNTDGLTVRVPRANKQKLDDARDWWERITGLQLEEAIYKSMIIRDVNNYIAVYENGSVKRKGAYEWDVEWHQNAGGLVIAKVAEKVMIDNSPIRQTLEQWPDIMDFMLRAKVPRSSHLAIERDGVTSQLQNITRYYVAEGGGHLFKWMPPLAKNPGVWRKFAVESGWGVQPCNDIRDAGKLPVDFDYYVREVEKLCLGLA
jgi:hypothetical protein